jgi:hypothetical protein
MNTSGRWIIAFTIAVGVANWPRPLAAQSISVSGNPATMSITTAIAGAAPTIVMNSATRYNVSSSGLGSRIRARLTAPLPPGVMLRINLQAPGSATSSGWITLTTANQLVVTNLPSGSYSNLQIQYELSATAAAGVVTLTTRVVTLTVSLL